MKKTISKFLLGILVLTSITSVFAADTTTQVVIEGTNVNVTNTSGGSTTVNSTSGGGASVTLPGTTTVISYGSAANSIVNELIAKGSLYTVDDVNYDSVPDIIAYSTSATGNCPTLRTCVAGDTVNYAPVLTLNMYIYSIQKNAYELYTKAIAWPRNSRGGLMIKNYIVYDSLGRGRLYINSAVERVTDNVGYSVSEVVNYGFSELDINGDGYTDVRVNGTDYVYNTKKQRFVSNDVAGTTQVLSGLVSADKTETSDYNGDSITDMIFTTTTPEGKVNKSYYVGQAGGGYKASLTTDLVNSVSYINVNPVVDSVKDIVSITTDPTTLKDAIKLDVYDSISSTYITKTTVGGIVGDTYNWKDMNGDSNLDLVTLLGTTVHVYYYNVAGMIENISYDLTAAKDDISFLQIGGSSHIDMLTKKKVGTFNSVVYYEWEVYIYNGTTFVKKNTNGQLLGKAFTWYNDINVDGQTDFYIDIGTVNSFYYSQRSTGNIKFLHSRGGLPEIQIANSGSTPVFLGDLGSKVLYNLKGDLATTSFIVKANGVTQVWNTPNTTLVDYLQTGRQMSYGPCSNSISCQQGGQESYTLLTSGVVSNTTYNPSAILGGYSYFTERKEIVGNYINNSVEYYVYGRTGSNYLQVSGTIYRKWTTLPGFILSVHPSAVESNLDFIYLDTNVSWVGDFLSPGYYNSLLKNMNVYQYPMFWNDTIRSYVDEVNRAAIEARFIGDVTSHITGNPRKSYSTMQ